MTTPPDRLDIKYALQKRYGSIAQFERDKDLPERSVKDVLAGKSRPVVARAIADALGTKVHRLFPSRFVAPNGDTRRKEKESHRQNAEAK